VDTFS